MEGLLMMSEKIGENRKQLQMFSMDDLVPQDHLLRKIDMAIDWSFIYDLVRDKYADGVGRPSIDPVVLIKIPIIQYLYNIKSMRQTIKDIEVNAAYRWFLGLDFYDPVPHFSTFGKNYTRRFAGTDLFEQIFERILEDCMRFRFVDPSTIYVDATHIKAHANSRKHIRRIAKEQTKFYSESLRKEIDKERAEAGKKPLKDKDEGPKRPDGTGGSTGTREIKESMTDPDSGWFHKGEHKQVFAYCAETACDSHGWILGYTIHPGNQHDSMTFPDLYEKIKKFDPDYIVADAAYKTPAIAKMLIDDGIDPVFPYKRPMTKKGFFRKQEYVFDDHYDKYICPNNEWLHFSTINREGYREYKSNPEKCGHCPYLSQCTQSSNHQKVVTRHVWEDYMEKCEDIRLGIGMKEKYARRKETIERIFGTAKEFHQMRYTNMTGMARMKMKVGLTFACMNLKKLTKMISRYGNKDRLFLFQIQVTVAF